MSGQEKYQVVSAGKTLRARASEEVLRDAAKAFSIPLSQARRLLVKGWVIKDQLSSKQVLEYRARLQKIGLRVEVFPAGKFDNRALLARMQFAQKRRARGQAGGEVSVPVAVAAVAEVAQRSLPAKTGEPKPAIAKAPAPQTAGTGRGRARAQVESLFEAEPVARRDSAADKVQLALDALSAALVPGVFSLLLCLCIYAVTRALWRIPQSILVGEFGAFTLIGSLLAILMAGFVAALLAWPFFAARRRGPEERGSVPLKRADAQGLHLLLEVLAEKTGLPQPGAIAVHAGVEVLAEPGLGDIHRQQLPLSLGLGAVRSLGGNELLAMVARALGIYRGKLCGITAWLVLDTARRLQQMQWALENDHSLVSAGGEANVLLKPLHTLLVNGGRVVLPLVDRLCECHRALSGHAARRLERRGDAWAAQIVGSEGFVRFAEKWHQLVHAELVVAEINREASIVGQRLRDYPAAVHWMLCNLDGETRSNIELAMAQTSDSWDPAQAADNERIAWAEELRLPALVRRDFSVQKLFDNLDSLIAATSASAAAEDTRPVENQRLLSASRETEQALQLLGEYFNQLPPRRFLPLEAPAGEDMQSMDLQEALDWLRGRLVELRELGQRLETLLAQGAAMQLGAGLIRIQSRIQPREFFLSGATPAAADESLRDNRARRGETEQQIRQMHRVFYLRIARALEAMSAAERQGAQRTLELLRAYSPLAPRLEKLDHYADLLGLMIDRLSLDAGQRDLVQKYLSLAARELEGIFAAIGASGILCEQGLDAALRERVGRAPLPELPRQRQGVVDALQAMELKCKNASAAIGEHYRIRLARLLEPCLKQERAIGIRPLRLVKQV